MWTSEQDAAAARSEKPAPQGGGGLGGLGDSDHLGTDKITFGQGGASTD